MAKISGFKGDYIGLDDNDAWSRVYDVGKNLMPIRNNIIQKKYNDMFRKKTKVVRSGKVKVVKTDTLVPDDVVFLEKGSFIPVDGIILEENGLELENDILFDAKYKEVEEKYYVEGKPVYQGMKVKSGRTLVETKKTGASTFLAEYIKEIDGLDRFRYDSINKYFFINVAFSIIVFILGFLFAFFKTNDFVLAFISSLVILIGTLPIGFCIMVLINRLKIDKILAKARVTLKNKMMLLDFKNIDVICVDSRFLTKDYNSYIQNIYKAGIGICVIGEENLDDIVLIAKESGVVDKDFDAYSGDILKIK